MVHVSLSIFYMVIGQYMKRCAGTVVCVFSKYFKIRCLYISCLPLHSWLNVLMRIGLIQNNAVERFSRCWHFCSSQIQSSFIDLFIYWFIYSFIYYTTPGLTIIYHMCCSHTYLPDHVSKQTVQVYPVAKWGHHVSLPLFLLGIAYI